jgi:hypothetical protein
MGDKNKEEQEQEAGTIDRGVFAFGAMLVAAMPLLLGFHFLSPIFLSHASLSDCLK